MQKLGRTIVAKRDRMESESSRMQTRKRQKTRQILGFITVLLTLAIVGFLIAMAFNNWAKDRQEIEVEGKKYEPTVEIYDQSHSGHVSDRVKDYVGQMEYDLDELGYKVTRAVLPAETTREVDFYLEGYSAYFKVNIDRETGVSAEDIDRMIKYLTERNATYSYVDVRIEGRAYYK